MNTRLRAPAAAVALPILVAVAVATAERVPAAAQPDEAAIMKTARAIHERVIALDTHDDIDPRNFSWSLNYTQDLDTQVNLPKMKKGDSTLHSSSSMSGKENSRQKASTPHTRLPWRSSKPSTGSPESWHRNRSS